MRLVTLKQSGKEVAAVRMGEFVVSVSAINVVAKMSFALDIQGLLEAGQLPDLAATVAANPTLASEYGIELNQVEFGPLYRHPRKIWGIGLNYREHAGDLHEKTPTEEPASFIKADTTLIGPNDSILLPPQSDRVTAEAEIAVVIGKRCKDVSVERAAEVVAGYTTVLDMTAEDILQKNPRFLTRAKNFDTFFSFGPELLTPDEIPDLHSLTVGTYSNGGLHRDNVVANMTFLPLFLVAFHSRVMTLLPGDIISTGTPGAVVIRDGDVVECRINGFLSLVNPVHRLG